MTQGKRLLLLGGSRGGGKSFLTMSSHILQTADQNMRELVFRLTAEFPHLKMSTVHDELCLSNLPRDFDYSKLERRILALMHPPEIKTVERTELVTWLTDMGEDPGKLRVLSTNTLRNMAGKRAGRSKGPRSGSGSLTTGRLPAQEPELWDLPRSK